jgi:hypothetical protein
MPVTYENIATTTLSSAASSITFSGVPTTYTDLRVVLVATADSTLSKRIQFNSDTSTGTDTYSNTKLGGNGSSTYSARQANEFGIRFASDQAGDSTTIPMLSVIDIFSYRGSTFKTILAATSSNQSTSGYVQRTVGLWRSTDPITSVILMINGANYQIGTTATLYGIKNA